MEKKYDILKVIKLKDKDNLSWSLIEEIIGVSFETLRKAYKREKDGIKSSNSNCYENLKLRGLKRKYEYVVKRGGKCECCGYDKNLAVLEFHHSNPEEKEFQVDVRAFSNYSLEKLEKELEKCELLCANCHREHHNPELTMENVPEIVKEAQEKKSFNNRKEYKQTCPICGTKFPKITGKIYCSEECRWKAKGYPSIEEVNEQYKVFGNWEKVAQHFGLTRKVIQGIRKRNS